MTDQEMDQVLGNNLPRSACLAPDASGIDLGPPELQEMPWSQRKVRRRMPGIVGLFGLVMGVALALTGSPAIAEGPNPQEWVDALDAATNGDEITVFTASKVYTMNPGQPEATAVAVLDGKILSVGSLEKMQPWLSRYDHTIDESLADKVILPGFIEPHTHMYMSAGFMSSLYIGPLDWPGRGGTNPAVPTHDDILATLAAAIEEDLSLIHI